MAGIDFDKLPDDARVWIFGASAPLDPAAETRVRDAMASFFQGWQSHGQELAGAADVKERRFLFIGVPDRTIASGCSIDKLFQKVRAIGRESGVDFLDSTLIFFRQGEEVRSVTRAEFRRLVDSGEVDASTTVYDLTPESLAEVRAGRWSAPAARSWHGAAFGLAPAAESA